MAESVKRTDIVLLFDNYSKESEKLYRSFKMAGEELRAFVLDSDGFEPEGVKGIFDYFLENDINEEVKPLYFNQIRVPEFWGINGTSSSAAVINKGREMAKIYYSSALNKRQVRIVEWYNEDHVVRCSDHYNKYGRLFARTTFNSKGEKCNKSYFSSDGKEIIVENYITKDIILNEDGIIRMFKNRTEIAAYIIERMGFATSRIFYNSLSYPFFVSERLLDNGKKDLLFWQEEAREDVPGNMQIILNNEAVRTSKIIVQKKRAYDKLLSNHVDPTKLVLLGNVYDFKRANKGSDNILICTNSDQIVHIDEIVEGIPEATFHICAYTEMSPKLMKFDQYKNVKLYPNIKRKLLDELFEKCDIYLDINKYNEIADGVFRAFLNNMLILGFEKTLHNEQYLADINIYAEDDYMNLIDSVINAIDNKAYRDILIREQHDKALVNSGTEFLETLML